MKNKTVLITGASRGIGAATARRFAAEGYQVAIHCHRHEAQANDICRSITEAGGYAAVFRCDVSNADDVDAMVKAVLAHFGAVDVLVNNAGVSHWGTLDRVTEADYRQLTDVNLGGTFHTCRALYGHMVSRGSGVIVNVSSMWGNCGASCEAIYSMTKAGIIGFTKALAAELGPAGIRVNAIAPGAIDTDMMAQFSKDDRQALCEETPLGRIGSPDDCAKAIYFLASDHAAFVTGQVLGVNGGFVR